MLVLRHYHINHSSVRRMESGPDISTKPEIWLSWETNGAWLGRCDIETRDFPGDAAEFQHVIRDYGGADFSRRQGHEHIVHRPQAIV